MADDYQGRYSGNQQNSLQNGNNLQRGMDYTVDMVFCIDATGSMEDTTGGQQRLINMVKKGALSFYEDLTKRMTAKHKQIRQLRVRIIAFRDYIADGSAAMMVTDFFRLPQQSEDFAACINSIHADGGGDIPEDGLEALAYAIRSDWIKEGAKRRQVIVVWSDAGTHPLQYAKGAANYPKGMPKNMNELSDWWDEYMEFNAKRLVLFTPSEDYWNYLSANWDHVVHFPSKAGSGLAERTYDSIMDGIIW